MLFLQEPHHEPKCAAGAGDIVGETHGSTILERDDGHGVTLNVDVMTAEPACKSMTYTLVGQRRDRR